MCALLAPCGVCAARERVLCGCPVVAAIRCTAAWRNTSLARIRAPTCNRAGENSACRAPPSCLTGLVRGCKMGPRAGGSATVVAACLATARVSWPTANRGRIATAGRLCTSSRDPTTSGNSSLMAAPITAAPITAAACSGAAPLSCRAEARAATRSGDTDARAVTRTSRVRPTARFGRCLVLAAASGHLLWLTR